MQEKTKKKGFTLIELIVVIAILGVLAAIAVPRLANVQKNAKISADQATAQNIIQAGKIYIADKNLSTSTEVATTTIGALETAKFIETGLKTQSTGNLFKLTVTGTGTDPVLTVTDATSNEVIDSSDATVTSTGAYLKP